nr:M13 family metallopeptidase [Bacteroidota bacterium]
MRIIKLILCFFLSLNIVFSQESKTIDFDILDTTISPDVDFYRYCSGKWLDTAQIPEGYSRYGFFDMMEAKIDRQLINLMQYVPKTLNDKNDSLHAMINKFYQSGMDTVQLRKQGILAIEKQLSLIKNIQATGQLVEVIAYLQLIGINPVFEIHQPKYWELRGIHYLYLRQTNLYVQDGANNNEGPLIENSMKLFQWCGYQTEEAREKSNAAVQIEKELSLKAQSEDDLYDFINNYNLFTIKKLDKEYGSINWEAYLNRLGLNSKSKVIIGQPEYFKQVDHLIATIPIDKWKSYLEWKLLMGSSKYMGKDFRQVADQIQNQYFNSGKPEVSRELFVMKTICRALPATMEQLYALAFFDENTQHEVGVMVENLRKAFIQRIEQNQWLDESTKDKAKLKIENINFKIGAPPMKVCEIPYPDIPDENFIQNIFNARTFHVKCQFTKFDKKVEKSDWTVLAFSTNAWYGTSRNDVTLPAGYINQLFNINKDKAYNYGTLGTGIAHEMTHAIDDMGRKYDQEGKYKNWWKITDEKMFNALTKKLTGQYNQYIIIDTIYVNGEQTLDENIADAGGLNIAFDAFVNAVSAVNSDTISGYSPQQRFFIAYGQKWRDLISDETLKKYRSYYHSLPKYRTNGVVSNSIEFYKAFGLNNEGAVIIW